MKSDRSGRTSQFRRHGWVRVTFIFVLAAAMASFGLLTERSVLAGFTSGPSVRVSPNNKIEIRWIADFVGDGKVEVFNNANGGTQIAVGTTSISSNEHRVEFTVGGVIQANTTYFFKVTHSDPAGVRADLTNDPAPYPPFFTGAQTIGNVFVDAGVDRARILWDANVIGIGRVDYGTTSPDELSLQGPGERHGPQHRTDRPCARNDLPVPRQQPARVRWRQPGRKDRLVHDVGVATPGCPGN
jgi:hypothetical protein